MWDHGVLLETARITYAQGILAGLCGGAAMAVVMATLSTAADEGPWQLPRRLAAIVFGQQPKDGAGVIVFGYAMHFVLSAAFGALFALVADRLTHEFWMTGLAYALTLWVLNFWGAQITPGGRATMKMKTAWLGPIAHIAYGGAMAAVAVLFAAASLHAA